MLWLLLKPMAVAASFMDDGTDSRAWHVVIASAGRISNARQQAARISEVFAEGKKVWRRNKIRVKPKSPMTIDGVPAKISSERRTKRALRLWENSARYIPQPMPGKSTIRTLKITRQIVPAQAGHNPSQTGFAPVMASQTGVVPKKSSLPRAGAPRVKRKSISPQIVETSNSPRHRNSQERPNLVIWRKKSFAAFSKAP